MSISRLPSGRWRAQVYDARTGKNISAAAVLKLDERTFVTKAQAKQAREAARARLVAPQNSSENLRVFWERWTSDPLFARPKESTNRHNRERTQAFVERYGHLRLDEIDDRIVAEWLEGGKRNGTVSKLGAMFNDACSKKAGRLIRVNPFAGLRLPRSTGNRDRRPPTVEQVWAMIAAARRVSSPSFAGWLRVACFTGMRPGELDALRWPDIDLEGGWINVSQQWNVGSRTFTSPKNGRARQVPLHDEARSALLAADRSYEFCFTNMQGDHWRPSGRAYHWKATRAACGWQGSLYLATRHFAGAYMFNTLLLPAEDVAFALGHEDGGELVRSTYGHRDRVEALERVKRAYAERATLLLREAS